MRRRTVLSLIMLASLSLSADVNGVSSFLTAPYSDDGINLQQGWYYHPNMGGGEHKAIDYVLGPIDQSSNWSSFAVVSAHGGEAVYLTGYNGGLGNHVSVTTNIGETIYQTIYAHLESSPLPASEPTTIVRGEFLGMSGVSGAANGVNHLHFVFKIDGVPVDPYDIYSDRDAYPENGGSCGSNPFWINCPPEPFIYLCSYVSQSILPAGPYLPGQIVQCEVQFRNEGTSTWSKAPGSDFYVELASCNQAGVIGTSFLNYPCDEINPGLDDWVSCQVPGTFGEASVPPGEVATFTFRGKITEDPEVATPGTHLVYFAPVYNGAVIPGWGQMHYPIEVRATDVWLASSPLSNNCNGPLVDGRWWYDEFFDESSWTQVALPVTSFGCNTCDRFFRYRYNYENLDKTVKVFFASDDGLTLFVNGLSVGSWGLGCHGGSCVNNVPWYCARRYNVPAIDITTFLHPGYNQIAVHVTEASGGEYFNLIFIEEDISTQLTGACCLGETCVVLGDEYTAADCVANGGQIYSGLQYDCGQHSPCLDSDSKIVSDPITFFETSLPLPPLPAQLEFSIIDTLARTAYYILPEELGGQTIYISDFSGSFTVTAAPSGDPDTVYLTVDEYNFVGASVNFDGLETGINYVYLDTSITMETNGYFAYSSGKIELVVPSIIVNDLFTQENPIRSRSHIRGYFNNNTGTLRTVSQAYNVLPSMGCCYVDRGNVDGGPDDGTFATSVDIADLVFLIAYSFQGGPEPACYSEADVDGVDQLLNISDIVYLIDYMFQGGPAPVACP